MLVCAQMERVKGIEPSYAAWEAAVLPLNYTRGSGHFTGGEQVPILDDRRGGFCRTAAAPGQGTLENTG
jgi:hypothetical protein